MKAHPQNFAMRGSTLFSLWLALITGCIASFKQETTAMESLTPPTAETLLRVVWMGRQNNNLVIPFGSGVIVSLEDREYLVTAHHVAANCNFDPLVRYKNQWYPLSWRVVGDSEKLDVTVLESDTKFISADNPLPVSYGDVRGVMHGQIGYALGFPRIVGESGFNLNHIMVVEDRPIPLAALLVVNLPMEGVESAYSAAYINDGYSGGAIVARVAETGKWTILGIIKNTPTVKRPVFKPGRNVKGKVVYVETGEVVGQHTGLIGYTPWSKIEELIPDSKQ